MDSREIGGLPLYLKFNRGLVFCLLLLSIVSLNFGFAQTSGEKFIYNLVQGSTISQNTEWIMEDPFLVQHIKDHQSALASIQGKLAKDSSNANLNYKMALFYLLSLDEHSKAIPYLKKSIKKTVRYYDYWKEEETSAPVTALYLLGKAYLEDNKPDSALLYFKKYQDAESLKPIATDKDLSFAINALTIVKNKSNVQIRPLGNTINSAAAETNPVLSTDGATLAFASRRQEGKSGNGFAQVYFSRKDSLTGTWGAPVAFQFNASWDMFPLAFSPDGKTLYFSANKEGQLDVYYSSMQGNAWTTPQAFDAINDQRANENGLSFTQDGKTLFFSSGRNKAVGHYDIYKCVNVNNQWSVPERLSLNINTAFNEISPVIKADGTRLFFSANGYASCGVGGYDVFYSDFTGKPSWSSPQSLGIAVNSGSNEVAYVPTGRRTAFLCKLTKDNSYDLFEVSGLGLEVDSVTFRQSLLTTDQEQLAKAVLPAPTVIHDTVKIWVHDTVKINVVQKVGDPQEEHQFANWNGSNKTAKPQKELVRPLEKAMGLEELSQKLNVTDSAVFKVVYFETNAYNLNPLSTNELTVLLNYIKSHPRSQLKIVGHSDNSGNEQHNIGLSRNRALAVLTFINTNLGSKVKATVLAKGSSEPKYLNDTEEHRAGNRRVELYILK